MPYKIIVVFPGGSNMRRRPNATEAIKHALFLIKSGVDEVYIVDPENNAYPPDKFSQLLGSKL